MIQIVVLLIRLDYKLRKLSLEAVDMINSIFHGHENHIVLNDFDWYELWNLLLEYFNAIGCFR